jgi:putative CocE/NonD family hydrolase
MVTKAIGSTAAETLDWLGAHLRRSGSPTTAPRAQPVRVYVTGRRSGWIDLPDWPPPTVDRLFYPNSYGVLGPSAPESGGRTSRFRYDPADPTPTVGGRLLTRNSGYTDDTALTERADVVTFTSTPLEGEVAVFGHPVVELDYQTDNPHFDVFVRVSEVDERGRSRNVSDGFRRFDKAPDGPVRVQLDPVAHRFAPGSRIRVLVAGGCHPRFARNLGTGEPPVSGSRMVGSTHTIRHGEISRLILPVGG